jgi:hypothetical protein
MTYEQSPVISNGTKRWISNGRFSWDEHQLHRENGPAIEAVDGTKRWYLNGKKHRIDGPAIEYPDEYKQWWIHGKQLTEAEYNRNEIK